MSNIIVMVCGFIAIVAGLCDKVIFLEAQKKQLNLKFESWWNSVRHHNREEFALLFAKKVNSVVDHRFGKKLLSIKLVFRLFFISSGLLLTTLAALALLNRQPFGGPPWKAYDDSVSYILTFTDWFSGQKNWAKFPVVDVVEQARKINTSTNDVLFRFGTNYYELTWVTNAVVSAYRVDQLGKGGVTVFYNRLFTPENSIDLNTNSFGVVGTNSYTVDDLLGEISSMHRSALRWANSKYRAAYSVAFYFSLFALNFFLFVTAMFFARIILREVAKSGSVVSLFALVFTNGVLLFLASVVLLFVLTVLAVPLFWFLMNYCFSLSHYSVSAAAVFSVSVAFVLFVGIGSSTKVVLFITLLPGFVALLVGSVSLIAVRWRNVFYFAVQKIVIRLVENNPFVILLVTASSVAAFLTLLGQCVHFLSFLW